MEFQHLPFDVQMQIVNSMKGMENAKIIRPGYAIEYDSSILEI